MLALIHIPKTGGTYLTGRKFNSLSNGEKISYGSAVSKIVDLRHVVIIKAGEKTSYKRYGQQTVSFDSVSGYDLFTNVRNPFSWFVSYGCSAGDWNKLRGRPEHPDREISLKTFKEFIHILAAREDKWPGRKFLFHQMFCGENMVVDWINRMEDLDDDAKAMAEHYGLEYTKREKANIYPHKDYREYYDKELIEFVHKTWPRELGLFGYAFEGLTRDPILGRFNHMKDRITYGFDEDELFIDGKIYTGQ